MNPNKYVSLPKNSKTKISDMNDFERIKELRADRQIPLQQPTAMPATYVYCKTAKADRRAEHQQVELITKTPHSGQKNLLSLWIASQLTAPAITEKIVDGQVLEIRKN